MRKSLRLIACKHEQKNQGCEITNKLTSILVVMISSHKKYLEKEHS